MSEKNEKNTLKPRGLTYPATNENVAAVVGNGLREAGSIPAGGATT
jgi:hypothetical protein